MKKSDFVAYVTGVLFLTAFYPFYVIHELCHFVVGLIMGNEPVFHLTYNIAYHNNVIADTITASAGVYGDITLIFIAFVWAVKHRVKWLIVTLFAFSLRKIIEICIVFFIKLDNIYDIKFMIEGRLPYSVAVTIAICYVIYAVTLVILEIIIVKPVLTNA